MTVEKTHSQNSLLSAPPTARPDRWPLLALLITHATSLLGNQLTQLAIPWFVLQTTGSAAQTGLTAFFGLVPLILAGFFGGVLVDRLGYKRASVIADIASGLSVALIPLLQLTVGLEFWQLLILVFLGALLDAPGLTAREALLPDLAARGGMQLSRANAIYETIQGGALLLGPAVGGLLIAALGPVSVLWFNAATFAFSALFLGLAIPARLRPAHDDKSGQSYFAALTEGWRYVLHNKLLRSIILLATWLILFVTPIYGVIMPFYMQKTYRDATTLGLLLSIEGGSTVLGAILYGVWGHRLPARPLLIVSLIGTAVGVLVTSFLPPLLFLMAASLLTGFMSGPLNPLFNTILQERIPPEMRGRVLGLVTALAVSASPLGVLVAGYLLEIVGLQITILGLAVGFLAVSLSTLFNRALDEMDKPASREVGSE